MKFIAALAILLWEICMTEKKLKPIVDKDSFSKKVKQQIDEELFYAFYKPLLDILETSNRVNTKVSLLKAFESGRLQWADNYIRGELNAILSLELKRMGAEWDKSRKAFKFPLSIVPLDLRTSMAKGSMLVEDKLKEIKGVLSGMKPSDVGVMKFDDQVDATLFDLERQATKSWKEIAKDIEVPMALSQGVAARLRTDYNLNLNLYVRDWAEEAIARLREATQKNVEEGFRADKLSRQIRAEYGVSQNKAKFLAIQESSLLVSKYRKERYTEAGVQEYIWSTSHDDRVRKRHKDLDKKRFSWDSPPIVDQATGRRAHPGEDFRCRCVAIPVLRTI